MNVWKSFQGCAIALAPFVVSILTGAAVYVYLRRLDLPAFVTVLAAVIACQLVFMLALILIGGTHERK